MDKYRKCIHVVSSLLVLGGIVISFNARAGTFDYLSSSPFLMGDWKGERTNLSKEGINFDFSYTNEAAHNFTGGSNKLTRAAQQVEVGVTLDLDKLRGIKHTTFDFVMTDRFGRSLDTDANLNTSQQTQEIYGRGQTVWLTKMTLDRTFFNDRLEVSVGRDSEGATFDAADCHFQSLALCGSQGPNLYGSYWMSWPGSVWMGRAKVDTSSTTYVQFGIYQQSPTYYDSGWERRNAWAPTSPNGTDGVVLPLELDWTPKLGGYDGHYLVGVMYNTGGQPDLVHDINGNQLALTGLSAKQTSGSYNAFLSFSQRVSGMNGGEGLTVGIRAVAGDRATSELDRQMSLSFEYQKPFDRALDRVGLGFSATHTSSREAEYQEAYNTANPADASAVGHSYEYVTEIYYSWQVIPSVALQPDMQFVLHPGGTSQNSNVFVVGLKSTINF